MKYDATIAALREKADILRRAATILEELQRGTLAIADQAPAAPRPQEHGAGGARRGLRAHEEVLGKPAQAARRGRTAVRKLTTLEKLLRAMGTVRALAKNEEKMISFPARTEADYEALVAEGCPACGEKTCDCGPGRRR